MKIAFKARKTKSGYSLWIVHSDGTDFNGKPIVEVYRAKIYLTADDWNEKKKALKSNSPRYRELRGQMIDIERRILMIRSRLIAEGVAAFPADVRRVFEQKDRPKDLVSLYAEYIDKLRLSRQSKYIYEASMKKLALFNPGVRYENLGKDFGSDFVAFMMDGGMSANSANSYLVKFRKFIGDTFVEKSNCAFLLKQWETTFNNKYKKPYLLPEERELWENGEARTGKEQAAKDIGIFLMEMNYRFGEAYALKPESNINGVLHHIKNKTKKDEIRLWRKPMTEKASVIWGKYKGVLPFHFFVKKSLVSRIFNDHAQSYAKYIGLDRKVFDKHGEPKELWELITSHIFRHTFARKKWREEGFDPVRIGLAMGHEDPASIRSYLDPEDLDGFGVFEEK